MADADTVVLTINSGSSSIKFALFTLVARPEEVVSGAIAGIGSPAATLIVNPPGGETASITKEIGIITRAPQRILEAIEPYLTGRTVAAIAHRIVHGGERFNGPRQVTPDIIEGLKELIPLAPNHLSEELGLIDAFSELMPGVSQVVCFDTAFHHDLPEVSRTLPVPASPGLRRYGFHGLSYGFLLSRLEELAGPAAARGRVVLAHLGNGASLAAVAGGQVIDTSMGLTPAGGVVMSTRAGDLDPSVVTYLARTRHLSPERLDELLTHESGLFAISGRSGDIRELLAHEEADPRARLAIAIFCYQIRKWVGAFAAALGGLDTLVFAGGIGEHAPSIRARICEGLAFLGLDVDTVRNATSAPVISTSNARVCVRVIPTDEALMMARQTRAVLAEVE